MAPPSSVLPATARPKENTPKDVVQLGTHDHRTLGQGHISKVCRHLGFIGIEMGVYM